MSKEKYLYGASIQGIQSFIFQTNKLKEIVGASELVEQICTDLFYNVSNIKKDDENIILSAAGNIKYVFNDMQKCKDFVKIFPKEVTELAPGITISQAVVEFEGNELSNSIQLLEDKLKAQRNLVPTPFEIGFMGLERARRTSGVAEKLIEKEALDGATLAKRDASDNNIALFEKMAGFKPKGAELAFDTEDITKSGKNSWIAIIHADGNGLGQIIQNKGKELVNEELFADFSKAIDDSTKNAVKKAFEEVVLVNRESFVRFPIRPIVIGGDDLTVIIRADLALDFTKVFLENFELESSKMLKQIGLKEYEKGLTACAGIVYIKESYPLHYGLSLAEKLCSDAKKRVKECDSTGELLDPKYNDIPKSSLSFYKVQESFIEDLKILKERTLKTSSGLDYYKGPYLLSEIIKLNEKLNIIQKEADENEKTKAAGKLRQIVSETYKDTSTSIFMMKRMKEVNKNFYIALDLDNELTAIENNGTSQLLDLITLHSFNYGNREN